MFSTTASAVMSGLLLLGVSAPIYGVGVESEIYAAAKTGYVYPEFLDGEVMKRCGLDYSFVDAAISGLGRTGLKLEKGSEGDLGFYVNVTVIGGPTQCSASVNISVSARARSVMLDFMDKPVSGGAFSNLNINLGYQGGLIYGPPDSFRLRLNRFVRGVLPASLHEIDRHPC